MTKVNLKEKTACVIDYGCYIEIAQRISRDFKKVYFCHPSWQQSFPKWNSYMIGMGVPGIERIESIWPKFDEIDIFIFPDLFQGDFQDWLRSKGKYVYGAGKGEQMEIYRDEFKEILADLKLDVNDYEVVDGLDNLRKKLEKQKNVYIKTNVVRGNLETFHWDEYKLSKPVLDELEHSLGIFKNEQTFIIEKPIRDAVEYGCDMFVVDGKYPLHGMVGIEIKDCGYVSKIVATGDMPDGIQKINKKLSNNFAFFSYRGPYSNEIKVTADGKNYLLDMTCRQPQPPTSIQMSQIENISEVIWDIATGIVPEINATKKYAVQAIIKSDWAKCEPQAIYFPEKYSGYVSIKNLVIQDGVKYYVPIDGIEMEEIGAVVGIGNTLKDAIDMCCEIADTVKGYCVHINCGALDEAVEEVNKLTNFGIKLF